MKLHSDSFPDNGVIPAEFAFAQIDQKVRVRFADNKNPHRPLRFLCVSCRIICRAMCLHG